MVVQGSLIICTIPSRTPQLDVLQSGAVNYINVKYTTVKKTVVRHISRIVKNSGPGFLFLLQFDNLYNNQVQCVKVHWS